MIENKKKQKEVQVAMYEILKAIEINNLKRIKN